jgi:hypothetical protein
VGKDAPNVIGHTQKGRYGICFAPSVFVAVDDAKLLGRWAEELVMANYRTTQNTTPVTDWMDSAVQPGNNPILRNPVAFFEFLVLHNPELGLRGDEILAVFKGKGMKVPDIVTNKGLREVFYEIKPGSTTGIAAADAKVAKIVDFMSRFSLLYKPGTVYNPGKKDDVDLTPIVNPILQIFGPLLGVKKVTVTFTFRRPPDKPGVLLYWICLDIEFEEDVDDVVVENIARWYVLHVVRIIKRGTLAPPMRISVDFADPAVNKLVPAPNKLLASILSAAPAREYMIVGGSASINVIRAVGSERMNRQVSLFQPPPGPAAIRRMNNNSWLDRNIDSIVFAIEVVGAGLLVVSVLVVVGVATGGFGLAAAPSALSTLPVAAPTLAPTMAPAAASLIVTETSVVAGQTAVGAAIGEAGATSAAQFAVQQAGAAALRSAAVKAAATSSAGLITVLALNRNAVAATMKNADPSEVQVVKLVAMDEVMNPAGGGLTTVRLRDGSTGVNLGSVRIENFEEIAVEMDAHRRDV